MLVCSTLVIPGFQLLVSWASDMDEKDEKSGEEQEDSSDEFPGKFLEEFLEEFLEDDED
jgi:hypothetical protein